MSDSGFYCVRLTKAQQQDPQAATAAILQAIGGRDKFFDSPGPLVFRDQESGRLLGRANPLRALRHVADERAYWWRSH